MIRRPIIFAALLGLIATLWTVPAAAAPSDSTTPAVYTGTIGGAEYRVEMPENWNGDLLLYSHGYRAPGGPNPALVIEASPDMDDALRVQLLDRGYALAGSAYRSTGWAVQDALTDQVRLLDWFDDRVGKPRHTYSWGNSMGGLLAVLLAERNPSRFSGVLAMCGDVAGPVDGYNAWLDIAYTVKTLLAPDSDLQVARITDGAANQAAFNQVIGQALRSGPEGQARLALANALSDMPGWFDSHSPAPTTVADQVLAQWVYDAFVIGSGTWGPGRVELEQRGGGNPSWNTGVDYRQVFVNSSQRALVERAYQEAGLDLDADLARLNAGTRISADPSAVAYLSRYGAPLGLTPVPVVTMHTTGDGVDPVENERDYADRVRLRAGGDNLRQMYVERGFHCAFTPAETLAALDALAARVTTGTWGDTSPAALNTAASAYPDSLRQVWSYWDDSWAAMPPAFVTADPGRLPRSCPHPGAARC